MAPTVLVVGGGATGTGVARDLALRGVDVTLVERGRLTAGTTGRMHGLLHSGARYAVSDPESARECIAENRILRDVAAHCIEETGGLFVARPEDDGDYVDRKLEACHDCGIPAESLSGAEARTLEPALADDVTRAIRVPDAAIDPFRLTVANAAGARERGARIETRAEVTDLLVEDGAVVGADIRYGDGHERAGQTERVRADHVVNAAGAWSGQIAAMAGVEVNVSPSKGAMVVTNVRPVDTVVNRCRPKTEGDIVVPHETTAILGTTDVAVEDPDASLRNHDAVEFLVDELAALLPSLASARVVRAYWGVRPLYSPSGDGGEEPTDVTRTFSLLDHAERDDVPGLTTVVGGKLTTYRLMAERVADRVCEVLGVRADCETDEVPLPGSDDPEALDAYMDEFDLRSPVTRRSVERLGSRASDVLGGAEPNPVVCECEGVTRAEVRDALAETGPDLGGVRIRTRATMGTCQGAFCARRLAAELHPEHDVATVDDARRDLLEERWRGHRYALWGEQLSQAALNHALRGSTLNRDGDPGDVTVSWDAFDDGRGGGDGGD